MADGGAPLSFSHPPSRAKALRTTLKHVQCIVVDVWLTLNPICVPTHSPIPHIVLSPRVCGQQPLIISNSSFASRCSIPPLPWPGDASGGEFKGAIGIDLGYVWGGDVSLPFSLSCDERWWWIGNMHSHTWGGVGSALPPHVHSTRPFCVVLPPCVFSSRFGQHALCSHNESLIDVSVCLAECPPPNIESVCERLWIPRILSTLHTRLNLNDCLFLSCACPQHDVLVRRCSAERQG